MKNIYKFYSDVNFYIGNLFQVLLLIEGDTVFLIAISGSTEYQILVDKRLLEQIDIESLNILAKFYASSLELGLEI